MKRILLFISLAVLGFSNQVQAQCPYDNTFYIDMTPPGPDWMVTELCAWPGDMITVNVVAGETYIFWGDENALFNDDLQMTLYTAGGGSVLAYGDDEIGTQPVIYWTATFTGTVNLLVDYWDFGIFSCSHGSNCNEINVAWVAPDNPAMCGNMNPICTNAGLTFDATSSGLPANPANNYGCLLSQPDPTWYYFEIATSGNIDMQLSAGSDIDYAIWGPFADLASAQAGCGSLGAPIDCSYSTAATEYPTIVGANVGEVYVMVITNYAGVNQNTVLQQIGGTGSTDCSIVIPCAADAGTVSVTMSNGTANNYVLCENDQVDLDENLDAVMPPSPDIAGLGYAIYACTPTTGNPDTDPCWTGYYWTGGNFSDVNNPSSVYDFLVANPLPGYAAVSGQTLCYAPITMDDIATIAAGGADDNLGHDIDGDMCFDQGTPICVTYLDPITFNVVESCGPPNSVTITISGGYPGFNGGSSYTVNYTGAGSMVQSGAQGQTITVTGYNGGETISFDVTNDGNTCTETFSYISTCASCGADVGTFTVTMNGSPAASPVIMCEDDCFNVISNGDYTLPPAVPGEVAEVMYAIYDCTPSGNPDPSLDACYTGLLWTGDDLSDCNDAASIIQGAGLGTDIWLVPITMDDGDDNSNPNGLIHWDNDGDLCWDIGTPIEIVYLAPITANITQNCDDIVITLSGGYPGYNAGSSYNVTNTGAGSMVQSGANGEILTFTGYTAGQTISVNISDGNGCTATASVVADQTYATVNLVGITDSDCTSPTGAVDVTISSAAADCNYTINMFDSYGDGWNGATMAVTVNGSPIAGSPFTLANGFSGSTSFTVPAGQTVVFTYSPGTWEGEVTYDIILDGNIVFSDGPNPSTGVVYSASCPGASYLWSNGATTEDISGVPAGSYSLQVTSGYGCITNAGPYVVGVPAPPPMGTDVQSACVSYTWIDGITYFASTNAPTYTYVGGAANGCDSTTNLNLTINNPTTGTDVQAECDSYTWIDGITYTSSNNTATYTYVGGAANGCDSTVTLNLTITNSNTGTDVQTACDTYTWIDGITYTSSNNTAQVTLTNAAGCDSVVTLNLTINNANTGTDVQTACDSYTWIDGNTYTSSNNTAQFTLTNAAGCDSVVTLNLTIGNSNTGTDVQTACVQYTWIDGNTYTSNNNTATWTLTNASGCDSVVTLNLTIDSYAAGTDIQTACDSYTWIDGNTYTSSNNTAQYTYVNGSVNGCDSIVTLNLTITNSNTGTDVQTVCDSYTWIDGVTYTSSNNTAQYTLTNAAGCDSLVTLNLTINNSNTGTDVQTACDTYTWIDGVTYTSSNNTAQFTLTNAAGCDSVVTLNLTINNSNTGVDQIITCDSYTWIDGITYTSSNNTATWLLTNAAGCDSLVTLDLTITALLTGTDVQTACDSYTWIDGNTYTASNNTAQMMLVTAGGCDSLVTLDLTINNSTTGTDMQTACDSYTWIDGNTYTASNNTAQFLLSTSNGCDSLVTLDLTINNASTGVDTQEACDSYTWIDGNTYTASNNTATVILTNAAGCDSIVTLDLTINDCQVVVPTAISPDGDQINDVWELVDIDMNYPDNVVRIYNRWGNMVYESDPGKYNSSSWDGTYEGKPLPVGSYYFIIDLNDENKEDITGAVSIVLNH